MAMDSQGKKFVILRILQVHVCKIRGDEYIKQKMGFLAGKLKPSCFKELHGRCKHNDQLCLSKNFSIRAENAAKPAQPAQAALGPPAQKEIPKGKNVTSNSKM